jgi:hypothetical protein
MRSRYSYFSYPIETAPSKTSQTLNNEFRVKSYKDTGCPLRSKCINCTVPEICCPAIQLSMGAWEAYILKSRCKD